MPRSLKTSTILAGLALALLASCGITKTYQAPSVDPAWSYRGAASADTNTIAQLPYQELFRDPVLQGLIAEGLGNNLDLLSAYASVERAEALFRQSKAAFYPNLSGNASAATSKLSEAQGFGIRTRMDQFQLGLSTAWEADVWGRLKSNKRANLAAWLRTEAAARAVRTSLIGSIASNYYRLLALDAQIAITTQTVVNWDSTVVTMRALKQAALVTEAAVVQSEAQRQAAQVTLPDLRQQVRETEHILSVLLGRPAGEIARGTLGDQVPYEDLRTGIPAQLLANRPDVQQAEYNYANAFELTNVARTAFYPTFSISASGGFNSLALTELLDPASMVASITGGLTQPIFNRRQNKTNLEVAQADQQIALLDFRSTLLVAGQEVSDALYLHQTALEKMEIRQLQITALEASVAYTQELLRNGFANYNEVITANQSLLSAELGRANDKLQQLQALVELYRALGGGAK